MKKVTSWILVLALLASIATGCASAPAEPTQAPQQTQAQQGAEPAAAEKILKIGVICPLSGTAGDGAYIKAAAELASNEINAAGGIGGSMKIQLLVEDDEGTPAKSVTVAQKLVTQDKVDIVVGAQQSSCTLANMVVTQEAEIPQITPASSSPKVTQQGNPWIFRTSISDLTAAQTILKYIGQEKGWKKIALVHDSSDFGINAASMIESSAGEYGLELAVKEQFNADDADFTSILTKVKSAQPDAIVCWGYFAAASLICKQMKQNEIDIPFIGYGFNNPSFTELGAEWVEGAIVATGFTELSAQKNPKIAPFADAFRAYYSGKSPTQVAAQTYDTFYIIKAAIESIGVENMTNETLRDALAKTSFDGVTGQQSFDEFGDIVKDCTLVVYDAAGQQQLLD